MLIPSRAVGTRRTPTSSGRAQKRKRARLATARPLPLCGSRRSRPGQILGKSPGIVPFNGLTVRPAKSPRAAVELQRVRAPDRAADGYSLRSRRLRVWPATGGLSISGTEVSQADAILSDSGRDSAKKAARAVVRRSRTREHTPQETAGTTICIGNSQEQPSPVLSPRPRTT